MGTWIDEYGMERTYSPEPDPKCPLILINDEPNGDINRFVDQYRWLSNMWLSDVEFDGVLYRSVEHVWHASKTLDVEKRLQIASICSPYDARLIGRSEFITEIDLEKTSRSCLGFISNGELEKVILSKVINNSTIYDRLMATGNRRIISGRVKTSQGVWHGETLPNGEGPNSLGQIWMRIRSDIVCTGA